MAGKVIWFEVVGKDLDKLKDFYGNVFDWKLEDAGEGMPYAMAQPAGEENPVGGIGVDPSGGQGHVTWYAESEDLQADLERAEKHGGKTVMPPTDVMGNTQIALLSDPEGHVVGLVNSGQPPG